MKCWATYTGALCSLRVRLGHDLIKLGAGCLGWLPRKRHMLSLNCSLQRNAEVPVVLLHPPGRRPTLATQV